VKIWDARCKDMIVLPDGLLCYEGLNFEPIKDLLLVASIIAGRQNKTRSEFNDDQLRYCLSSPTAHNSSLY